MDTREELVKKRDALLEELEKIEQQLEELPAEMAEYFWALEDKDLIDKIISKIKRIRAYSGVTDSRKNQMNYSAVVFETLDGKIWKVVHGSNWCSSIAAAGPVKNINDEETWDLEDHFDLTGEWRLREESGVDRRVREVWEDDRLPEEKKIAISIYHGYFEY